MQRIILDTDPGIDDALALFFALASPEIQLDAITTVSGNVPVELTTRNALALLELAGRVDIPVARGSERPIVRDAVIADYVHGNNGLGDIQLPEPQIQPVSQHAVDLIIEKIMASPGEITLVPIGPLTNIALALRTEPRIAQSVREVVIMGGALNVPGNVTPAAEFNIYADPHAAHIVMHAGWPIRLVSLDATMHAQMTHQQAQFISNNAHPVRQLIKGILDFYFSSYAPRFNIHTFYMHDPLCLAAAFQPDLITWEPAYVDIELAGSLTLGESVAFFKRSENTVERLAEALIPNVQASMGVNAERFIALFLERIVQTFHK